MYVIRHSLKPRMAKFMAQPLLGDQCQYKLSLPPCVNQFHSTSSHIAFMRDRICRSLGSSPLKYCRAHSNPWKRYEVSTRSAPSSLRLKGIVFPVLPLSQCGKTP